MRIANIWRVAARDLLSTLRDTRTLVGTVLISLLLIPLLMLGLPLMISHVVGSKAQASQRVGVVGTLPPELSRQLAADTLGSKGQVLARGVELVPLDLPASALPDAAAEAVRSGEVDAVLYAPGALPATASDPAAPLNVYAKLGTLSSEAGAAGKVQAAVRNYNRDLSAEKLEQAGLTPEDLKPVQLELKEAADAQEASSGQLAFLVPMLLINFILSGAMATALDSTAGEKERGTLESLLVTPVRRSEVVAGKLLATATTSLVTAAFSVLGFMLTGFIAGASLLQSDREQELQDGLAQAFGSGVLGTGSLLGIGISAVGAALLLSALLIGLSIYARNYKEAQTYVTPLTLLTVLPAMLLQFNDGFSDFLYAVPLFGSMLSILDSVKGTLEWNHLWLSLGSNLLFALLFSWWALLSFNREEVIFRN